MGSSPSSLVDNSSVIMKGSALKFLYDICFCHTIVGHPSYRVKSSYWIPPGFPQLQLATKLHCQSESHSLPHSRNLHPTKSLLPNVREKKNSPSQHFTTSWKEPSPLLSTGSTYEHTTSMPIFSPQKPIRKKKKTSHKNVRYVLHRRFFCSTIFQKRCVFSEMCLLGIVHLSEDASL